jgi:hypothetical protein
VARRGPAVVAVAALVVLLAGCRGATRLDAPALAASLPATLVPDHPEIVTDARCPAPIARKVGTVTVCTASIGGTPVEVAVTQTDGDGAVAVRLESELLDVNAIAKTVADRLSRDIGVVTTVTCDGPAVRVRVVGERLACTAAEASGTTRPITVEVTDTPERVTVTLS